MFIFCLSVKIKMKVVVKKIIFILNHRDVILES